MRGMWSSLKEMKMQWIARDNYEEMLIDHYVEQEKLRVRWEELFASDNRFMFDKETWLQLLKLNPIIKIDDEWSKISMSKKWKRYFWDKLICLKFTDWSKLWKIADVISFMTSIDSSRNDVMYLEMLTQLCFQGCRHLLMGGLEKIHISDQNQKQTLKIIEKAISFLRRKFDRFKPDRNLDDFITMKKILKIGQNRYVFQKRERKYILWKQGRCSRCKIIVSYMLDIDSITAKWSFKVKKKKKELSCLVELLKALEKNKEWSLKGDVILDIINESNFIEMFLWKEFWRAVKFRKR
jgi:hypothetical protein